VILFFELFREFVINGLKDCFYVLKSSLALSLI